MANFTGPLTVNGTANLRTLLTAAGFTEHVTVSGLKIFNPSDSVPLYVHYTKNGTTAPGTGTDGIPIGKGTADQDDTIDVVADNGGGMVDIGLVWLHTASSIAVKVMVIGA